MKFKLSKTSWLILTAGIFLVILAGLGLTRSQQVKEQTKVAGDLDLSTQRLATIQTAPLSQQLETLKTKVDESQTQLNNARAQLNQTVVSVDVADQFFQIAAYCSINITSLSTSKITQASFDKVTFYSTLLTAQVKGQKTDIVKFIIALNDGYVTGNVQSAQISFEAAVTGDTSGEGEVSGGENDASTAPDAALSPGTATAAISMIIYSYEEQ